MNSQKGRTLQDAKTSLSPAAVLTAAKQFFGPRNAVYAAFLEREGPNHLVFRGQGGEEIVIAARTDGGTTVASGASYMFDQQVARFLNPAGGGGVCRMSEAPFVTSLRARAGTVQVGTPGDAAITIRVQFAEEWDAVRVRANLGETVQAVKIRALDALDSSAGFHGDFAITFRGIKIHDEAQTLQAAGVLNGSTLLIEYRHRRPVR